MNKSSLFTAFNAARSLDLDKPRLNRALGICLRKEYQNDYTTTSSTCTCPDFTYRGSASRPCKHQIALVLKQHSEVK